MRTARIGALGAFALLALGACTTTLQTTSGEDYLARYEESWQPDCSATGDVDADVRAIAAVEPNLQFPARIGIARIEGGQLTAIPVDELSVWMEAGEELGPLYGEFVPVSPLIASMVSEPPANGRWNQTAGEVVANIRRGAARQHLDYVFVYDVNAARDEKGNALSLADITLIGLFVLPSRDIQVEAVASGLLIDVRNGYPYATVTTFAEEDGWARAAYSYSKSRELIDTASEAAVAELVTEAKGALKALAATTVDGQASR